METKVIEIDYEPRALQDVIHEGMDTHRFGAVEASGTGEAFGIRTQPTLLTA